MYSFKSFNASLHMHVSPDGRKVQSSQVLSNLDSINPIQTALRTGVFDHQGSSQPWTWAWTTDRGPFEIWWPNGLYLKVDPAGDIQIFKSKSQRKVEAPAALRIGKTGLFSYGLIGLYTDNSKISLVKDTYPFWDSLMNVTYDGLCEDEDFFPHLMMGRELASRLKIPFDENLSL